MGEKERGEDRRSRGTNQPPQGHREIVEPLPTCPKKHREMSTLPSRKQDRPKSPWCHCHFGTKLHFSATRVALTPRFSEIGLSTSDERDDTSWPAQTNLIRALPQK